MQDLNFSRCRCPRNCPVCGQRPSFHHMYVASCRDCDWEYVGPTEQAAFDRAEAHLASCN